SNCFAELRHFPVTSTGRRRPTTPSIAGARRDLTLRKSGKAERERQLGTRGGPVVSTLSVNLASTRGVAINATARSPSTAHRKKKHDHQTRIGPDSVIRDHAGEGLPEPTKVHRCRRR